MSKGADDKAAMTEDRKFIFSTADTCEFFGISRETLSTWKKKGAPSIGRGKWNIKSVMEWRFSGKHKKSSEARKLEAEADLKEAKAAQEKIKLGLKQDEFLATDAVKAELNRLFSNLKKSLLAISHNVAGDLSVMNPEAAETAKGVVDKRIEEALKDLSEGRLHHAKKKKK